MRMGLRVRLNHAIPRSIHLMQKPQCSYFVHILFTIRLRLLYQTPLRRRFAAELAMCAPGRLFHSTGLECLDNFILFELRYPFHMRTSCILCRNYLTRETR